MSPEQYVINDQVEYRVRRFGKPDQWVLAKVVHVDHAQIAVEDTVGRRTFSRGFGFIRPVEQEAS